MFLTLNRKKNQKKFNRRSAVIAWTAVSATALIGFASLAVDLGSLKVVKSQLQNAADASALAGASALLSPRFLTGAATWQDLANNASSLAQQYAAKNKAEGQYLHVAPADITVGHITTIQNLQEPISNVTPFNAVRVVIRKEPGSLNGPAHLYFAAIWGKHTASVDATATGYLDGHFSAYRPDPRKLRGPLIPVSVRRQKWIDEIVNAGGSDDYGYDPATGQVTLGPDGIREISIYPEKQKGQTSSDGAGDFGLLHIGDISSGTPPLGDQIQNGLSQADVIAQFGQPEIKFNNPDGSGISYNIDGTPGAKNSLVQLEQNFKSRIGTVIGFFIHDSVTLSGTNAIYDVTAIEFGRVMMVNAQGAVSGQKVVVIQPVAYLGDEIITDGNAGIHATAGRVRIIR